MIRAVCLSKIVLRYFFLLAVILLFLSGCTAGRNAGSDKVVNEDMVKEERDKVMNISQTGYTVEVPQKYKQSSAEKGTIISFDYDSKDYLRDESVITKTAYVYLPYGYDENDPDTKYDIVYLMHGWGGHAGEYFEYIPTRNMFDNMIENGDIPPVIIVSASFYNGNSSTDFSSSVAEFHQFHRDFAENLMPAIEGRFHTYAASVSDDDLKSTRKHRIFGGFSLGAVTTWLQLCYNSDYIYYFLPMSGSSWYYGTYGDFQIERNVDFIENLVKKKDLDGRGYFIYHAVGTNDSVKSQSIDMADEMLKRDIFTKEHYVFYQKDGGYHDFEAVQEYLYNALPLFFADQREEQLVKNEPYTLETSISDVINDPAFGNYGRLLVPANGMYRGETLNDFRLTYYSINPDRTVEICNYLKERAAEGETVFYDIYTDEEKLADPEKSDTGLFFFKGEPGQRFAICNAGGAFSFVGAMQDSFPHALELSKRGYNAFALIYRPGWETAMEDLARAIRFIFENAEELEVSTDCYSLWGGSAGARMAATLGTYRTSYYGESDYPRAGTVVMQYTGHDLYSESDPPTYVCVGSNDGIANWRTMKSRIDALAALGIPTEFHVYKGLGHGFGLGDNTIAEGWINDAIAFWESNTNK